MPSIDQISIWTNEETVAEIKRLLPEDSSFEEDFQDGWFFGSIQQTLPSSPESTILWKGDGPDRHLLLLNAFGWLWLRGQKESHPIWRPRPNSQPSRRHPAPFPNIPDPPDLDPDHIREVYQEGPKRKK